MTAKNLKTDYGALGNGIADDLAAFQAATAACASSGDPLLVPRGSYYLSDTLSIPSHLKMRGCGRGSCIWKTDEQDQGCVIAIYDKQDVWLEDLYIRGTLPAGSPLGDGYFALMRGVEVVRCSDVTLQRMWYDKLAYGVKSDSLSPNFTANLILNGMRTPNKLKNGGVAMPLYLDHQQTCRVMDSILHASTEPPMGTLFKSDHGWGDHHLYISKAVHDLVVDRIKCTGGIGFPIQLYNTDAGDPSDYIEFRDVEFEDVPCAFTIGSYFDHVLIDGYSGHSSFLRWISSDYGWANLWGYLTNFEMRNVDLDHAYLINSNVQADQGPLVVDGGTQEHCEQMPTGIVDTGGTTVTVTDVTITNVPLPTIEAEAGDGSLWGHDADYATARTTYYAGPGAPGDHIWVGQRLYGGIYYCFEGFIKFDTSTGLEAAEALLLSGYLVTDQTNGPDFTVEARVLPADWATLDSGDWISGAALDTLPLFATRSSSGIGSTGDYKAFAMAEDHMDYVNRSGVTALILVSDRVRTNQTPGADYEYLEFQDASEANPFKLTVI